MSQCKQKFRPVRFARCIISGIIFSYQFKPSVELLHTFQKLKLLLLIIIFEWDNSNQNFSLWASAVFSKFQKLKMLLLLKIVKWANSNKKFSLCALRDASIQTSFPHVNLSFE